MISCQTCSAELPIDANCCYKCGTFVKAPIRQVEPIPQYETEQITIVQPTEQSEIIKENKSFSRFLGLLVIAILIVFALIGIGSLISRSREDHRSAEPTIYANSQALPAITAITKSSSQTSTNMVSPSPIPPNTQEPKTNAQNPQDIESYAIPEKPPVNSNHNNINKVPTNERNYTINLKKRQHWSMPISFPNERTISGSFRAKGGFGDDIEVYIISSDKYEDFKKGQSVQTIYNSGRKTFESFNVPLSRGSYVLIVNNNYATFFSKTVSLSLSIN